MITDEGKRHIKRYLAGYVPSIAESIAIGIGSAAESLTDERLAFEVGRSDISLTGYDFNNDRLVFRATLPDNFAGTVYEVGLFSTSANSVAGEFGSKLITTFDSDVEEWLNSDTDIDSTFATTNARVGTDALRQNPSASTSVSDYLSDIFLDLSGHSGSDIFSFAFNSANTNVASVALKLMTDDANYYTLTSTSPGSGYKFVQATKSSATVTGTPSWENITKLEVTTTANSSGSAQVDWDGIRIEDVDTLNPDYVLVSRELLSSPYVKQNSMTQEIEFTVDVTI